MKQIVFNDFSYTYAGAKRAALNTLSLQLNAGEFVGVVGANNSGKSTFCYALSGVIPHLYHGELKGSVQINEMDNNSRTVSEIAQQVGLVLQVPPCQMSGVRFTVFEEVAFGLENRGVEREDIKERVSAVLTLIGLDKVADLSPFELSGGQQQRLALATVLAVDPPYIVLDEPTTFLDPIGAELVFKILLRLKRQGKTIIITEQRLDLIAQYTSRVLLFDEGKLVMDDVPRQVLTSSALESCKLASTRYTQTARLAREKGVLAAGQPLPASLHEAVEYFTETRPGHAYSGQ